MNCYLSGDNCKLIAFEKYLCKLKFYKEYINAIKNYNIDIFYVLRDGNTIKIFDEYPLFINQYDIEYYADRIDKIKKFCNQNKTPELTTD